MVEETSCHWGHEILNTSIRSLQEPTLENQLFWISVSTGAREHLSSSIFLSVWYCLLGSLQVTYFSFASLHSSIDGWLQNILIFPTDCLFYICRYVYFSWTVFVCFFFRHIFDTSQGVWLGNSVWDRTCISAFLPLFFPSLSFHISHQHTLQLCLAYQHQAAVASSINPLIRIWFNFLPAGPVSSKPNTQHLKLQKYSPESSICTKMFRNQQFMVVLKLQWLKKDTM